MNKQIYVALIAGCLSLSMVSVAQADDSSATPTHADKKAAKEQSKADKKADVAQAKANKSKTDAQADADKAAADAKEKDAKKE
ncbi:hypothetical protein [Paraburkholderia sp. DHOC27]|uniref:hypothetical protein n=1 Tax=Paraburkholderia sp. DHOC27 TaxID=2303330 RepID=UPI000E3CD885|nr:hypothetical protein [Paraburkholderia sp. DHOC27]RFU46719.1 hypothetical protein D0B32_17100 [Paraburkholderia sp. DHOC27]